MTTNVNAQPQRDTRPILGVMEKTSQKIVQDVLHSIVKNVELREGEIQALEEAIDLMSAVRAFLKQRKADTKEISRSNRIMVEARAEADGIMRVGSSSFGGHESLPLHSWITMRLENGSIVVERRGGTRVD